jgi:DNA-binding NtrC family response regulator
MNSQTVLILGDHARVDLVAVLSRAGFAPQVRGSVQHCLDKLRQEKFAVILVDREFTRADVLEFILNVRDIDQNTPIVVIGPGRDEKIDKTILKQGHTALITEAESDDKLGDKLAQVLSLPCTMRSKK